MNTLILFGIQEAIAHSPEIAEALHKLFSKSAEPTKEDWQRERRKLEELDYKKLVPNSQLK